MTISYEGNTPTIRCDHCGSINELIELYIIGNGLHCRICIDGALGDGHVGYVSDLCGTEIEECHLSKLGAI